MVHTSLKKVDLFTAMKNVLSVCLALALTGAASAQAPQVEAVTTLNFKGELVWQFETDIGTMHFYAAGELFTVDLMDGGKLLTDPIPLALADDVRCVRHISRTNILLVARAVMGKAPGNIEPESDETVAPVQPSGTRSFAIDLFSAKPIWTQPPLQIPDQIHVFPEANRVVLMSAPEGKAKGKNAATRESHLSAVDLNTGEVLWKKSYAMQSAWVNGPYLEVVGPRTFSLDSATGEEVRTVNIPLEDGFSLMAFPGKERVLAWKDTKFALYELPRLTSDHVVGQQAPLTIDATKKWTTMTTKKLGSASFIEGSVFVPRLVAGKHLLINLTKVFELFDLETGKRLWLRPKKMASVLNELEISPTGAWGAVTHRKKLLIVDMATGRDFAELKIPEASLTTFQYPRIMWQTDDELIVVLSDGKRRPRNITRVDVPGKSITWSRALPAPAKYRLTSEEKGTLAARILVAATLTAVSAGNPIVSGNYATTFVFIPNLDVKRLGDSEAGLEAMAEELEREGITPGSRALRRYVHRAHLVSGILGERGLFVAGHEDRYNIVNFDMADGETRTVADYSEVKVHGIEPDVVYGLAISIEQNLRQVKVLSLPRED